MMNKILALIFLLGLVSGCGTINKMMYEKKCNSGDWDSIGYNDGLRGKSSGDILSWSERCMDFNAKPDKAQYMKGVARGVTDYCANQGKELASKGNDMLVPRQCSASSKNSNAFKSSYSSEIKYFCTREKGLALGEVGTPVPASCSKYSLFTSAHKEGLQIYCNEKNAYELGKSKKEFNSEACSYKLRTSLLSAFEAGQKVEATQLKIKNLDLEISKLESQVYDPKVPADAKNHYKSILASKKAELRNLEREMYRLER